MVNFVCNEKTDTHTHLRLETNRKVLEAQLLIKQTKEKFTNLDPKGNPKEIKEKINEIVKQLEEKNNPYVNQILKQ
jgi:hypothetical protein